MKTNLLIGAALVAAIVVAVVALLEMDPSGARSSRTGSRYVEGVRQASAIDPAWIGWDESTSPIPIAMESPRGLAVDASDRICVIGDRLVILTAGGEPILRSAEFAGGGYRALAVDDRGRIVAAARDRVDVLAIDASTTRIVRSVVLAGNSVDGVGAVDGVDAVDNVDLSAIAVSTEWIFAADASGCAVYRLPLEDAAEGAPFERLADGFFVPSTLELTVSPDGELTTVDPGRHTIQFRDGYGDVVRSFGQRGDQLADFHGCCNPIAIAVTRGGQIVTAEKGLATTRVKVYEPSGALDSVVAGPDRFDHRPDGPPIVLDVAVDSAGRVLVLDPARGQVRVFERKAR